MNPDLACGTCGRRVSEMQGACAACGQNADEVRADVKPRVERLLQLHAALATSTHIYAEFERKLVEQELARYGLRVAESPAVG
jgi:hypothetical protein